MPLPLIAELGLAAGGAIAGGLAGRPKTTTSTPSWTPQQQSVQGYEADYLTNKLKNPGDVYAPARTAAVGTVNRNYAGLNDRLKASYAGRGFGRSGKVLTNARQLETSRISDIGGVDAQFAGMQTDYESKLLDQAQRFGFASPTTTTQDPGDVAGGALSGGLSTLTTLLSLNKLLGGGGGRTPGNIPLPGSGWEQGG